MYYFYSIALFFFHITLDLLTSLLGRLPFVAKKACQFAFIIYLILLLFNPIAYFYRVLPKDSKLSINLIELDEKFLIWKQSLNKKSNNHFTRYISKFIPVSGVHLVRLFDEEKIGWNDYLDNYYQKNKLSTKFNLKEVDGWKTLQSKKLKFSNINEYYKYNKFKIDYKTFYFKATQKSQVANAKGIYLSGSSLTSKRLKRSLSYLKKQKLNSIVYDIKDIIGFVNYKTNVRTAKILQRKRTPPIKNLVLFQRWLKHKGVFGIARIAMFQDEFLSTKYHKYSIYKENGEPLLTKGRRVWVDPNHKGVQSYSLELIWEVAKAGADEVQLDYIRYPAEGKWKTAKYIGLKNHYGKSQLLLAFLQKAKSLLSLYGIPLSLDVFGVVAWQEKLDIKSTGQDLKILSQAADVLSPMLYPSHFGNAFGGIKKPADHPYHFLLQGCARLKKIIPKSVIIRPWIQAFKWRVSNYGPKYITEQIRATNDTGYTGFLMWNAANKYITY